MHASNSLFQICFVCRESKRLDINIHHFQVVTLPAQYVFIQQHHSQHKYSFRGCEPRQCQLSYRVNHYISKYRYPLTTLIIILNTKFPDLLPHWLELTITHPSEVAHSLEVDKVAFAWIQRAVPVAVVSVIVAHSKGTGLWKAAGWQFGCVVVWCAPGLRFTVGHGQRETLLKPQLSLHFLHCLLFNYHLVCTGHRVDVHL